MIDQEKLIEKYPLLFKKIKHIECDSGWHPLLDKLFNRIEAEIKCQVPEEIRDEIYIDQVKEKFGTLRVYLNQTTPYIDGLISMAESISGIICEVCGDPGQMRSGGWNRTLCSNHYIPAKKK